MKSRSLLLVAVVCMAGVVCTGCERLSAGLDALRNRAGGRGDSGGALPVAGPYSPPSQIVQPITAPAGGAEGAGKSDRAGAQDLGGGRLADKSKPPSGSEPSSDDDDSTKPRPSVIIVSQ